MLYLFILIPGLTNFVAGDNDIAFNTSVLTSHYCFVNESTIRIKDSNVNIINYTGDWIIIMASNNIDLLMAPANGTNCTLTTSSVAPYSDTIYVIQIIIFLVTVLVSCANIMLHLFIKELQTISGALIVSLCVFSVLGTSFLLVNTTLTDQRNGELCAVSFYIACPIIFLYDSSKLCSLIHFSHLMYYSYKMSSAIHNKKSILCKYATLIVVLSIICSASVILVDLLVSKSAFETTHGRCTVLFDPSNFGSRSVILYSALLTLYNFIEIGFMIAGLVLYYLTTRRCCSMATRDVKISIALNCTIGINTGLTVVLYCLQVEGDINYAVASSGSVLEQLLLFCLFVTSSKVLSHLHCNHASNSSIYTVQPV